MYDAGGIGKSNIAQDGFVGFLLNRSGSADNLYTEPVLECLWLLADNVERQQERRLRTELLVLQVKQGQARAFEELVDLWQRPLWSHACRLTRDDQASWDITQEAWTTIAKKIISLEDQSQFPGWSFRIVTNKALALKAFRGGLLRVERLTWTFSGLAVMVFAFAWGLFMTTPDVKVMLFCMVLMIWGLAIEILFALLYVIRNAKTSILKEIKLQRWEQPSGTFEPHAVDFWGRDLSLRTGRAERWAWFVAIIVLALIAGVVGTTTTVVW